MSKPGEGSKVTRDEFNKTVEEKVKEFNETFKNRARSDVRR